MIKNSANTNWKKRLFTKVKILGVGRSPPPSPVFLHMFWYFKPQQKTFTKNRNELYAKKNIWGPANCPCVRNVRFQTAGDKKAHRPYWVIWHSIFIILCNYAFYFFKTNKREKLGAPTLPTLSPASPAPRLRIRAGFRKFERLLSLSYDGRGRL